MKRPASVKWALAVVTLIFGVALFYIVEEFVRNGWQRAFGLYFATVARTLRFGLFVLGFILVWCGPRRVAYGIGVIFLAGITYFATMASFETEPRFDSAEAQGEMLTACLVPALCAWLFFRFTFGRPSRIYYRLAAPAKPEANGAPAQNS
jgi:hypothetical protein